MRKKDWVRLGLCAAVLFWRPSLAKPNPDVVITVQTIAALRALPQNGQFSTVNVAGYFTVSDGGGGLFNWNSSSTTQDDGGIVINPSGHRGRGRYVRQDAQSSAYSPYWFGARGDGKTDDYAAWDRTVVAARNASQRAVLCPQGVFILGSVPLDVSGVSIQGISSIGCVLKRGSRATGQYTVKLDGSGPGGASRMSYRNFQIDGNRSSNPNENWGLGLIGNAIDNLFEDIQIRETKTGGLRLRLDSSARPSVNTFINLQVLDSSGKGVEIDAGRNLHFQGLDIELVDGIGLDISGQDESPGRIIVENFWIEKTGDGNIDAIRIAGYSDRVTLAYGNVQDYGNNAGTQGSGISIPAGRHVRLRGLDISPRNGRSIARHRKIAVGSSSRSITIEDHGFVPTDIEDNSSEK